MCTLSRFASEIFCEALATSFPPFEVLRDGLVTQGFSAWHECLSMELRLLSEEERATELLLATEAAKEAFCTVGSYTPFSPGVGWRSSVCEARRRVLHERASHSSYAQSLFFLRHAVLAEPSTSRRFQQQLNQQKYLLLTNEALTQQFDAVSAAPSTHLELQEACEALISTLVLRGGRFESRQATGGLCFVQPMASPHFLCLYWENLEKGLQFSDRGSILKRCFIIDQEPTRKSINVDVLLAQGNAFELKVSECLPGFRHYDHWIVQSESERAGAGAAVVMKPWPAADDQATEASVLGSWLCAGLSAVATLSLLDLLNSSLVEALATHSRNIRR